MSGHHGALCGALPNVPLPHQIDFLATIFPTDGRYVDVCESGDITLMFDLANGRQWKKRVWPRKEHPNKLLRWNSVEVQC